MRRTDWRPLAALFACFFAMQATARAATPSDSRQEVPQRIVSLDLCSDWMLLNYAPRTQVAALSPMRGTWRVADPWPHDWPTHDGSLERILSLKPDLVLVGPYNAALLRARLKELGVRVAVLPLPQRLDEIADYEKQFLALIGQPTARAAAPTNETAAAKRKRLLFLDSNGVGLGANTLEDDVMRRAGWNNYVRHDGFENLDIEKLLGDPPDAVLWSSPSKPAIAERFAEQPALRRAIPPARWLKTDTWRWQCPGPWTFDLVRQLERGIVQ